MRSWIDRLHRVEDGLLAFLLIAMIVLAGTQIVMRNLFDSGFVWIDPLLRALVLWLGLIGATVASRHNKHIRIDLLARSFKRNTHRLIQSLVAQVSAWTCLVIAWFGMDWIRLDYAEAVTTFAGIPAWSVEIIVPLAFALIGLRYLLRSRRLGPALLPASQGGSEASRMSFAAPFLLLLAILRTPLFVVIALSAMVGFYSQEVPLSVISIEIYRLAEMPVLLAIPMFTFAGYLLGEGQASKRLVNLTNSLLGWMPGGLAIVAIFACALFTAFTGASGITIVALGGLLYPALKQAGYLENFNLGLLTSSGSLGLLFAPSLPLILYGVVAQQMDLDQTDQHQ